MKRIVLFLATNVAIMVVLGITVHVLGLNQFMAGGQLNLSMLLAFSAVLGFGGSFISLLISKKVAKWSTGAQVIETPRNPTEQWLVQTVERFARKANIAMPEVAIYEGAPNAFATGPSKNNSLVAVSTGLLQSMSREEAEAVLAHEVAHVANGDMVTLTLIQGVVNTFVFFLARVVGFAVDQFLRKDNEESSGQGMGYFITVIVMEITLGILASIIVMYFSRQREFRADSGAAHLMGSRQPMISALKRLGGMQAGELPSNMAASGISGKRGIMALFSSHPPIEQRIEVLSQQR
ncbi:MAG: protease HtpX [Gammaproteobacteria bacterium]|nr:protease HtpX [Gammaproteobacteria bacterium]MBU0849907.1 protease HtpX [Gammaproteobacteria bacterium]MBU1268673.1 protease HtpX [Gammaproteobacteria bacterium]MBU1528539.1 protease HtpX [Gammaproteobacteria bacterium]MBU1781219.1 protease HtpX [Gammaproteobacteria bacterium]